MSAAAGSITPRRRTQHPPRVTRERLDSSLARGAAWTVAMKGVGQAAAWLATLVVARLLSPTDYGIFGMATLYLGLLQMLSEFGIGTAIVAQRKVDDEEVAQLNTVVVGIGALGALLLCASAPIVAWFFKSPRLVPVLLAMSTTFVISSLRTVPWAMLQRDLRFKRLALYDATQAVVLAAGSIALAMLGAGYWTLVAAAILSAVLSTGLTLYHHPTRFARPTFARVRKTLSLGGDVVVQRLSWYGYSNADFLIAGRMLGEHALGAYSLAWTLANIPIDKLGATILQVTPGVLTRASEHPEELRRYVVRITEMMILVLAPVTIGLAVVAPVFVHAALGQRWEEIIIPLQLLCVYATVRALMPLFSQILLVQGLHRYATRVNVALVCIMPPVFVIGSRWGIVGIALGWLIAYPLVAVALVRRALQVVGLTAHDFVRTLIWPVLSACVAMVIAVLAVRLLLPNRWPPLVALPIEVVTGALVYVAVLLARHGDRMREIVRHARTLRNTAPEAA